MVAEKNRTEPFRLTASECPLGPACRVRPCSGRALGLEPRAHWPRGSPCAKPPTLIKGQPGAQIELAVTFEAERRHLPVVTLRCVA